MNKLIDFSMKVLVVDDFATMRKIVRNVLKQIGFDNIVEAEDGVAALNVLKHDRVGLVIFFNNFIIFVRLEDSLPANKTSR